MYLEINNLHKFYGEGDNRNEVLKGITCGVDKGQICVLLGPSGSGKSTLLNIIGGIDNADEGYISINGEKTIDMNEKKLSLYRRKHLSTLEFEDDRVYVSDGILKKYKLEEGDTLTLKKKFSDDTYDFKIYKGYDYPASMAVFMSLDNFRETFDMDKDYFTGYLSKVKLDDIDDDYVAAVISPGDLTVLADQLTSSMGSIFGVWTLFSIVLSVLVIYLLSKIIIEKNANSVSLVKILGFNNGEISNLYMTATGIVVLLSTLISLPLCGLMFDKIFVLMMSSFNAWIELYIDPKVWLEIPLYTIVSYVIVALLQFLKIKRIPMDQALKNVD